MIYKMENLQTNSHRQKNAFLFIYVSKSRRRILKVSYNSLSHQFTFFRTTPNLFPKISIEFLPKLRDLRQNSFRPSLCVDMFSLHKKTNTEDFYKSHEIIFVRTRTSSTLSTKTHRDINKPQGFSL